MSDKLWEILNLLSRGIRAEKSCGISTDNYIVDAIYDIKQWALGLLPEESELNPKAMNYLIAEIRKKIEEEKEDEIQKPRT